MNKLELIIGVITGFIVMFILILSGLTGIKRWAIFMIIIIVSSFVNTFYIFPKLKKKNPDVIR